MNAFVMYLMVGMIIATIYIILGILHGKLQEGFLDFQRHAKSQGISLSDGFGKYYKIIGAIMVFVAVMLTWPFALCLLIISGLANLTKFLMIFLM